jgi:type IV pilus assembly protein PilE
MNNPGFTLIELLIVLAIVSILTCIAYPCYTSYVIKARRSNAAVALMNLADSLEQYYDDHHSYKNATLENLNINNNLDFYQLAIVSENGTEYRIEAIPKDAQAKADIQCGTLILDQIGNRSITGTGNIDECW